MWSWYSGADVCFAYLADVSHDGLEGPAFDKSQWWTRGWTLKELLAPKDLIFFSSDWSRIGRKKEMDLRVSQITGINPNVVNGTLTLESISVAQRMSWASARTTTREEDTAYCLMGLFGVNMPLLYGEGKSAFLRLQKEIIRDSDDETIFAWKDSAMQPHVYSGLLAAHPSAFTTARRVVCFEDSGHREPFSMTNKGLSIRFQMAAVSKGLFRADLHCGDAQTRNRVRIYLQKVSETSDQYARVQCNEWAPSDAITETHSRTIYIKQSFDQTPIYKPLSKRMKSSVRLLQLIPTADDTTVKARLIEADVKTARYKALSRVWPDHDTARKSIWLQDQPFDVDPVGFDILKKFSTGLWDDLLWIDAICINQTCNLERSEQIALKRRIYEKADEIFVWSTHWPPSDAFLSHSKPGSMMVTRAHFTAEGVFWRPAWVMQELVLDHRNTREYFYVDGAFSRIRERPDGFFDEHDYTSLHKMLRPPTGVERLLLLADFPRYIHTQFGPFKRVDRLGLAKNLSTASRLSIMKFLGHFVYRIGKDLALSVFILLLRRLQPHIDNASSHDNCSDRLPKSCHTCAILRMFLLWMNSQRTPATNPDPKTKKIIRPSKSPRTTNPQFSRRYRSKEERWK